MPGYSFYRSRGQALLHKWNQIPNKLDVLITHTPPLGIFFFIYCLIVLYLL